MLPKTGAYVESYDGKTKWIYFLMEDNDLLQKLILIGIKSALISKKSLIASMPNPSCMA